MGPFPQSQAGNRYILVMVDFFTKWAEVAALPNQEARTVAQAIYNSWVTRFGSPDAIHSDQGTNFESRLCYELWGSMGTHKTRTTPLHPAGNGMTERTNKTLLNLLRAFVDISRTDAWDTLLPRVLLSYRSTVHATTKMTPALMMYGRELRLPFDIHYPNPNVPVTSPSTFVAELIDANRESERLARENLQQAQERQAHYHNLRAHGAPFQPSDQV